MFVAVVFLLDMFLMCVYIILAKGLSLSLNNGEAVRVWQYIM